MYKKPDSKHKKEGEQGEGGQGSPLFVLKNYNESDTSNYLHEKLNKHYSIVELEIISYDEVVDLYSLNLTLLDLNGGNSSECGNKPNERLRYFECCVRLITGNTLSYTIIITCAI